MNHINHQFIFFIIMFFQIRLVELVKNIKDALIFDTPSEY